jgi:hypothetical protein
MQRRRKRDTTIILKDDREGDIFEGTNKSLFQNYK